MPNRVERPLVELGPPHYPNATCTSSNIAATVSLHCAAQLMIIDMHCHLAGAFSDKFICAEPAATTARAARRQ